MIEKIRFPELTELNLAKLQYFTMDFPENTDKFPFWLESELIHDHPLGVREVKQSPRVRGVDSVPYLGELINGVLFHPISHTWMSQEVSKRLISGL